MPAFPAACYCYCCYFHCCQGPACHPTATHGAPHSLARLLITTRRALANPSGSAVAAVAVRPTHHTAQFRVPGQPERV